MTKIENWNHSYCEAAKPCKAGKEKDGEMLYQITWWWVNAMETPESIELSADDYKTILDVAMTIAKCRYIAKIRITNQYNMILAEIHIPG